MKLPSLAQTGTIVLGTALTYVSAHQFSAPWSTILPPAAALVTALWHLYAPSPKTLDRVNPWK
ncbi:MAG TPA: hypothetical protein VF765_31035 [Polyangiaceae bacterium]